MDSISASQGPQESDLTSLLSPTPNHSSTLNSSTSHNRLSCLESNLYSPPSFTRFTDFVDNTNRWNLDSGLESLLTNVPISFSSPDIFSSHSPFAASRSSVSQNDDSESRHANSVLFDEHTPEISSSPTPDLSTPVISPDPLETGFVSSKIFQPPTSRAQPKLIYSVSESEHYRVDSTRTITFLPPNGSMPDRDTSLSSPTHSSPLYSSPMARTADPNVDKPHFVFVPQKPRPLKKPTSSVYFPCADPKDDRSHF